MGHFRGEDAEERAGVVECAGSGTGQD